MCAQQADKVNRELKQILVDIDRCIKQCENSWTSKDLRGFERNSDMITSNLGKKARGTETGVMDMRESISEDPKFAAIYSALDNFQNTKEERLDKLRKIAPRVNRAKSILDPIIKLIDDNRQAFAELGYDWSDQISALNEKFGFNVSPAPKAAPTPTTPAAPSPTTPAAPAPTPAPTSSAPKPADIKKFETMYKAKAQTAISTSKNSLDVQAKLDDLNNYIQQNQSIIASIEGMQSKIDSDLELIHKQWEELVVKTCIRNVEGAARSFARAKDFGLKKDADGFKKNFAAPKDQMNKPIHPKLNICPLDRREAIINTNPKLSAIFDQYDELVRIESELLPGSQSIPKASAAKPQTITKEVKLPSSVGLSKEQTAFMKEYQSKANFFKGKSKLLATGQSGIDDFQIYIAGKQEIIDSIEGMQNTVDADLEICQQQFEKSIVEACQKKIENIVPTLKSIRNILSAKVLNEDRLEQQYNALYKVMDNPIDPHVAITPVDKKEEVIALKPDLLDVYKEYEDLTNNKDELIQKRKNDDKVGDITKTAQAMLRKVSTATGDPDQFVKALQDFIKYEKEHHDELLTIGLDYTDEINKKKEEVEHYFWNTILNPVKASEARYNYGSICYGLEDAIRNQNSSRLRSYFRQLKRMLYDHFDSRYYPYSLMDKKEEIISYEYKIKKAFDLYDQYKDQIDTLSVKFDILNQIDAVKETIPPTIKKFKEYYQQERRHLNDKIHEAVRVQECRNALEAISNENQNRSDIMEIINGIEKEFFDEELMAHVNEMLAKKEIIAPKPPIDPIDNFSQLLLETYNKTKVFEPEIFTNGSMTTEIIRHCYMYACQFQNQELDSVKLVKGAFEKINQKLKEYSNNIDEYVLLQSILGRNTTINLFKGVNDNIENLDRGTILDEMDKLYQDYKSKTGKTINIIERKLTEKENYQVKTHNKEFQEYAKNYINKYNSGKCKAKRISGEYMRVLKFFKVDKNIEIPFDASFLRGACINWLDNELDKIKDTIIQYANGKMENPLYYWCNTTKDYMKFEHFLVLLEVYITTSPNFRYSSMDKEVKDCIDLYNTLIVLNAASLINAFLTTNKYGDDIYGINYNNSRILILQNIIRKLLNSIKNLNLYDGNNKKLIDSALESVQLDQSKIVFYPYETNVLIPSIKSKIQKLINTNNPTQILEAFSYVDYLLGMNYHDSESEKLIDESFSKCLSTFGFVPHLHFFVSRCFPMFLRSPSTDEKQSIFSMLPSGEEISKCVIKKLSDFNDVLSQGFRILTIDHITADILHLLHQQRFDSNDYQYIFKEKYQCEDTLWFKLRLKNKSDYGTRVKMIYEDVFSYPQGITYPSQKSMRKIYSDNVIITIFPISDLAIALDMTPESCPYKIRTAYPLPNLLDEDISYNVKYDEWQLIVETKYQNLCDLFNEKQTNYPITRALYYQSYNKKAEDDTKEIVSKFIKMTHDYDVNRQQTYAENRNKLYKEYIDTIKDKEILIEFEGNAIEKWNLQKVTKGINMYCSNYGTNKFLSRTFVYEPSPDGSGMRVSFGDGEVVIMPNKHYVWIYNFQIAQEHDHKMAEGVTVNIKRGKVPDCIPIILSYAPRMESLAIKIDADIDQYLKEHGIPQKKYIHLDYFREFPN
ncbi:putative sporulation-specific protein [Histomonas meleagridis]|uniref:putative sporulation-specific protein n=1 Tax=Histomonas meleagridis TaxID=135588 RepID=UPI00355A4203|nr:putative sporulation-specific protein [Histomonas meleagridis]KAH0798042.1 putative sporulation-specific protein [Histomonas meleagridis]